MRKTSGARKSIAVVLLAVLLASFLFPLGASASETEPAQSVDDFIKRETHYDIAVVFDNSLSMFFNDDGAPIQRWSRAKFAMEIFASMLDLKGGDTLTIFPMWKTAHGETEDVPESERTKKREESLPPYLAKGGEEITSPDDIRDMYTVYAGDTPFDAVKNALGYLQSLKKDDNRNKWLIILTDGAFDMYGDEVFTDERKAAFNINEEIKKIGADDISIQYLAIDPKEEQKKLMPVPEGSLFVGTAEGPGIQDELIDICNRIFQRNKIPPEDVDAAKKALTLEISMRKVVVFVQGEKVKINGLVDADGNKMAVASDSGPRQFSTVSFGYSGYKSMPKEKAVTDETLFGQVVTFENCPTGEYSLDISGAVNSNTLQVFYEPNVRVKSELYPKGGEVPYKDGDPIYKGEYTVKCSIVDGVTGEDVSDSPLLGEQAYKITITNNGKTEEIANGQDITLEPDSKENNTKTAIDVEYTYLKIYTIRNTDSPWSSERGGFTVPELDSPPPPPAPPVLSLKIEKVSEYYLLSEHDKWDAVRVNVKLDGKELSDEQLDALEIALASKSKEDPNAGMSSCKKLPGESAFEIYLYKDANGAYLDGPESGKEKLKVECTLAGNHEQEAPANWNQTEPIITPWKVTADAEAELQFTTMNPIIIWIIRLAVAAAIIGLILWFMSRKVLPKSVKATQQVFKTSDAMMEGQGTASLDRKAKRLKVASPPASEPMNCRISFEVAPESRRWTRSKERAYRIVRIFGAASTVEKIEINAIGYVKSDNGSFVSEDNPDMPLKINPRNTYTVTIFADEAQLECRIVNK